VADSDDDDDDDDDVIDLNANKKREVFAHDTRFYLSMSIKPLSDEFPGTIFSDKTEERKYEDRH
tara:strand:+ start:1306 stop:1497 length:192 start_codon:yes stop_codon:yes gene_type:complete